MQHGEVRIIGGRWRGRKLRFPSLPGLRPTPDRIRETLFNWLQPYISGARCLDLFAGSGALSFEALSRGAAYALLIDQSPNIINYLHEQTRLLQIQHVDIVQARVPNLNLDQTPFSLVFLDPPFHQNLLQPICLWLEQQNLLAPDALIYLEAESTLAPLPLPTNWQLLRSKKAGQVGYHLAQRA